MLLVAPGNYMYMAMYTMVSVCIVDEHKFDILSTEVFVVFCIDVNLLLLTKFRNCPTGHRTKQGRGVLVYCIRDEKFNMPTT